MSNDESLETAQHEWYPNVILYQQDVSKYNLEIVIREISEFFPLLHKIDIKEIIQYMEIFTQIQPCCGIRMDQSYRDILHEKFTDDIYKCALKNIDQLEYKLTNTNAYIKYANDIELLQKVSNIDSNLGGNYCSNCNHIIAEKNLQFNQLCTTDDELISIDIENLYLIAPIRSGKRFNQALVQ